LCAVARFGTGDADLTVSAVSEKDGKTFSVSENNFRKFLKRN
jgi:hypothetical protein